LFCDAVDISDFVAPEGMYHGILFNPPMSTSVDREFCTHWRQARSTRSSRTACWQRQSVTLPAETF